jgi:hypothetical protein
MILAIDPASPEGIAAYKQKGYVVLEVTVKRLYILQGEEGQALKPLIHEWFGTYRGRSHAYRDGSHVGGGDVVQQVRNLTDGGKVIPL